MAMRGRGVMLAAIVLSLCVTACSDRTSSDDASGENGVNLSRVAEAAERQQEEYEARLAAFNAQEAQRKQACFQLDAQQVELNH